MQLLGPEYAQLREQRQTPRPAPIAPRGRERKNLAVVSNGRLGEELLGAKGLMVQRLACPGRSEGSIRSWVWTALAMRRPRCSAPGLGLSRAGAPQSMSQRSLVTWDNREAEALLHEAASVRSGPWNKEG